MMRWPWKKKSPHRPNYHIFTEKKRGWGHDYCIRDVLEAGAILKAMGWKRGIRAGDFMIFTHSRPAKDGSKTVRYQVTEIQYYRDPPDMWSAKLEFSPRVGAVRPGRED